MIQEKTIEECIYSRLEGDSELADILCLFVEEMPARVAKLLLHLDEGNWEELRRTAHQLKGAAGSYGFEPLSPSANRVERAVRDNEPEEQIRESVLELVDLCGRVRCCVPE
ncbi:MAG: Hpt domain-containing protein [Planctomycetes bacterium]|nr:Hpt domain-containing protein [Planctomycetota bacterium]MCG2684441.1 Hpt domain-containing protein [Planctomycetales bacterium]